MEIILNKKRSSANLREATANQLCEGGLNWNHLLLVQVVNNGFAFAK